MKKRILTVLLAVCLVFALGTVTALAADEGFPDAGEGGVITLNKDIIVSGIETLNLSQNSLETNGHSITVTGTLTVTGTGSVTNDVEPTKDDVKGIFIVDGGTLNIQSGTFETAGAEVIRVNKGTANVSGGTFKCTAADVSLFNERVMFMVIGSESKLNFTAGTIDADSLESNKQHGLYGGYPANGATVVLGSAGGGNEPEIYTDFSAIALNNTTSDPATTVTINSGYYKSGLNGGSALKENCVIYLPGECNFVINGGTFVTADTNANVISIPYPGFNVDLSINGGTFNASTGNAVIKTWGVELPAADSNEPNIISIADGEFISGNTFADFDSEEVHDDFITGGTFSNVNDTNFDSYLAPGLDVDDSGKVVVGSDAVAQVGDTVYTNLQEAINAAPVGGTVTLLNDIHPVVPNGATAGQSGAITINKNITIDGKNLQIIADDGSFTTTGNTGNFHVINITGGNVTIKNLNIDGCDKARSGINVWGNGTANPTVKIEGTDIKDCTTYGVTIGSATVTADGLRTSGGGWGGVNVDTKNGDSSFTMESGTLADNYSVVVGESASHDSVVNLDGGTYNTVQVKVSNTDVNISRGTYGKIELTSGVNKGVVDVTGGTFKTSVSEYVDSSMPYEAKTSSGLYTYHRTPESAADAAGQGGDVNYILGGVTHNVTLYYDKYVQTEIEVPHNYDFELPGGKYDGKEIAGWTRGSVTYKVGDDVKVDRNMTFYVVLKDGEFDITIDSKIEHGDISTNVNSADKGDTVYIYVDPDTGYVLDDIDVYYGLNYRNSVKVSYVRNNTYRFEMPNADVYITATFKANGMPFVDVHRTQWFYDSIYYVWSNDMMEGDSATTFNPDGTMTRAMFWAVLGRMDGQTITGTNWVEQARNWAMREGVSDGTNPNDYVTREQMVTMLWRYAGEKNGSANLNRYTDSGSVSGYAVEAMRWAIGNGVIQGVTSTTLAPKANATRAECATIFMRFDKM